MSDLKRVNKIKNMTDLTNDLVGNYENLVKGLITEKRAKEVSNMSGKIINSCKTQLEYNIFMKLNKKIAFLDC